MGCTIAPNPFTSDDAFLDQRQSLGSGLPSSPCQTCKPMAELSSALIFTQPI